LEVYFGTRDGLHDRLIDADERLPIVVRQHTL
jgi:hypothetical protein